MEEGTGDDIKHHREQHRREGFATEEEVEASPGSAGGGSSQGDQVSVTSATRPEARAEDQRREGSSSVKFLSDSTGISSPQRHRGKVKRRSRSSSSVSSSTSSTSRSSRSKTRSMRPRTMSRKVRKSESQPRRSAPRRGQPRKSPRRVSQRSPESSGVERRSQAKSPRRRDSSLQSSGGVRSERNEMSPECQKPQKALERSYNKHITAASASASGLQRRSRSRSRTRSLSSPKDFSSYPTRDRDRWSSASATGDLLIVGVGPERKYKCQVCLTLSSSRLQHDQHKDGQKHKDALRDSSPALQSKSCSVQSVSRTLRRRPG